MLSKLLPSISKSILDMIGGHDSYIPSGTILMLVFQGFCQAKALTLLLKSPIQQKNISMELLISRSIFAITFSLYLRYIATILMKFSFLSESHIQLVQSCQFRNVKTKVQLSCDLFKVIKLRSDRPPDNQALCSFHSRPQF